MRKIMTVLLPATAILLASCGEPLFPLYSKHTLEIAGHTQACPASPGQQCYLVRADATQPWGFTSTVEGFKTQLYAGWIRGFDYSPGFVYNVTLKSQEICSFDGCAHELTLLSLNAKTPE